MYGRTAVRPNADMLAKLGFSLTANPLLEEIRHSPDRLASRRNLAGTDRPRQYG